MSGKEDKTIPGIPKTETVWVHRTTAKGEEFYTTSNRDRSTYFVYKMVDRKAVKLGKNKSPTALEEKYID